MQSPPLPVLAAFEASHPVLAPDGGLINTTYLVQRHGVRAVLQRQSPVIDAAVNEDIDALTAHLEAKGLLTPRPIRSVDGALFVRDEAAVWRMQTYLPGRTVHRVESPDQAASAGALVARFHLALEDFHRPFSFVRSAAHDTAAHLARLSSVVLTLGDDRDEAYALGREIESAARCLPPLSALAAQPRRVCHGDLKVSNIRFDALDPGRALALLDLDTLGVQSLAYELGDALRSFCNPLGEDEGHVALRRDVFSALLAGYHAEAPRLAEGELGSVVDGLSTICLELAARFCVDAVEDRYFGWDPSRFESRRAHNLVRARGQLRLGALALEARTELLEIVRALP